MGQGLVPWPRKKKEVTEEVHGNISTGTSRREHFDRNRGLALALGLVPTGARSRVASDPWGKRFLRVSDRKLALLCALDDEPFELFGVD